MFTQKQTVFIHKPDHLVCKTLLAVIVTHSSSSAYLPLSVVVVFVL